MRDSAALFGFRPGASPIHRLPAQVKLLALVPCTAAIFALPARSLVPASVLALILAAVARIPFAVFLRNARVIFWYGVFVCVFRFAGVPFDRDLWFREAMESATYLWRLFLVMLAGTLFYETTSSLEIRHALADVQERIVRFLGKFVKLPDFPDIAFLLSLTITFIPRIFDTWTVLNRAWDARGGNLHRGLFAAFRRTAVLVPLLVLKLLALAAETERAIRCRSA